jgi:hypothetical protein
MLHARAQLPFCARKPWSAQMDNVARAELRTNTPPKSVQEHIDELPLWADGTRLKSAPMTSMQGLIWSLAAAGKFFEGFVVFMTGVALPLLSREFGIGPAENGLITAATLFGILVEISRPCPLHRAARPHLRPDPRPD